jgi:hypothetical protein
MKHSSPARLMFIGTNYWGFTLRVPYIRLICKELSLLPSFYRLEWQGTGSNVYQGKFFSLIVDAVAKLRSLREIHIPYVDLNGAFSSLPQAFNGISIRLGTYSDTITERLGKQQEHLQELRIVCVALTLDPED